MIDTITLWGVGTTRTMRAHWMLHELGLDYETKRIESRTGETESSEYSNLTAKQKIPTLQYGDLVITESYAIMHYARTLSDRLPYDDYQLSSRGQAKYDEWLSFILMELDATSLYVVRRHKDLPAIYGASDAAVKSSIEYFNRMLVSVSPQILANQPIWGSTFSEIDILMTVILDWASFLSIPLAPHILTYQSTMRARPAYQAARSHNFRDLQLPTAIIPKP